MVQCALRPPIVPRFRSRHRREKETQRQAGVCSLRVAWLGGHCLGAQSLPTNLFRVVQQPFPPKTVLHVLVQRDKDEREKLLHTPECRQLTNLGTWKQ